jgi:hypothetical protein
LLAGGVTVFSVPVEVESFLVVDSLLSVVDVVVSLLLQATKQTAATNTRIIFIKIPLEGQVTSLAENEKIHDSRQHLICKMRRIQHLFSALFLFRYLVPEPFTVNYCCNSSEKNLFFIKSSRGSVVGRTHLCPSKSFYDLPKGMAILCLKGWTGRVIQDRGCLQPMETR